MSSEQAVRCPGICPGDLGAALLGKACTQRACHFPRLAEGPDLWLLPPVSIGPRHSELTVVVYKLQGTHRGMACKSSRGRHGNGDTRVWGGLLQGDRQVASHHTTAPHGLVSGSQPQNHLLALATTL